MVTFTLSSRAAPTTLLPELACRASVNKVTSPPDRSDVTTEGGSSSFENFALTSFIGGCHTFILFVRPLSRYATQQRSVKAVKAILEGKNPSENESSNANRLLWLSH
eukprot:scaffold12054_cov78-Skeletonema_menzelii.AAC.2